MEISNAGHQARGSHGSEEAVACPRSQKQQDKKAKPGPGQALKCPRCASTNTKFCYYNNYSPSQPRYFCKECRRYWTQGGSLRNVPVGGGCRKNKRSSASSSSSSKKAKDQDLITTPLLPTLNTTPPASHDPSDCSLASSTLQMQPSTMQVGLDENDPVTSAVALTNGFLDMVRNDFVDTTSPNSLDYLPYYGFGADGWSFERVLSDATASPTATQALCKAMDGGGDNKVLMGLRWQDGEMDSARDCWNSFGFVDFKKNEEKIVDKIFLGGIL
ncbi:hypothetical protein C4D60_Mb04t20160 [Musa balbisiana]|uniref:Dof zinc finger protein n=1 Tax=Musa balbisiana TaxID=52838 RepID=A0A4S8KDB9_MUSBA|nr:hypothetical protein C4D60_Mb04t20160 [Musa balbisiana]